MSHYVFHPSHAAVVVPTTEYQKYLDDGWYDSPLKFPKTKSLVVLPVEAPIEKPIEISPDKVIDAPVINRKPGRPSKQQSEKVSNTHKEAELPTDAA